MSTDSSRAAELSTYPFVVLGAILALFWPCAPFLTQTCPHQLTRAFLEQAEVDTAEDRIVSKAAEDAPMPLSRSRLVADEMVHVFCLDYSGTALRSSCCASPHLG